MIVNAGYRGKVGAAVPKFTYTGQYNQRDDGVVELLTSGTLVFLNPAVIDVFCVGGGGAGQSVTGSQLGGGGGGGGYTSTRKKLQVAGSYNVVIGRGGIFTSSETVNGEATFFGEIVTAAGGKGVIGSTIVGGAGGSGGGGGVSSNRDYGTGGSDGANGENGYPAIHRGGAGQGSTTREFSEPSGKLYGGGGGGGRYMNSNTPVISIGGSGGGGTGGWVGAQSGLSKAAGAGGANTGGGGGGGAVEYDRVNPGNGGSGICCFRAAK